MKRLYTLKLDSDYGGNLWVNEESQELKKLKGNKPFIITNETLNDDYVDITSIENLDKYGPMVTNNHYVIKLALIDLYDNNWEVLTEKEKKILAKFFIVDNDKIKSVLSEEEFIDFNHFKIYHYLNDDILKNLSEEHFTITPKSIDYKKSVKTRLHPKLTFDNRGFLTDVVYYSDLEIDTSGAIVIYNYINPIVKYRADYNTGPDGYTISRTTTRTWMLEDGSWSPDTKVSLKIYDPVTSRNEAKRRRRNLINNLLVETVGLIMMTTPELDTTQLAESDAMAFMHDIESAITAFYESGTTPDADGNPCKLIMIIMEHPYDKLKNFVPGTNNTVTIKDFLLSRIN